MTPTVDSGKDLILPQIPSASVRPAQIQPNFEEEVKEPVEPEIYKSNKKDNYDYGGTNNKLRELEILVFDVRGQLEKKLRQISEEFPSKLQRELTAIQTRDQTMWKDIQTKNATLNETLNVVKESYKNLSGSFNEKLNALQRKSDETELRLISIEKSIERISGNSGISPIKPSSPNIQTDGENPSEKINNVQFNLELNTIKEQLQEDHRKRDSQIDELVRNYSEMDTKLRSQISTLTQNLQRLSEMPKTPSSKPLPSQPGGPTKTEIEYMASQMGALEKKVDEEMSKRVRLEEDLLKYLDEKVVGMKEKMKQEEKGTLEREKKMLGNIQTGLVTINDILKGTNDETNLKITKIETELNHHMESLSQLVDNTNKAFASDISKQGEDIKLISQKLNDVEENAITSLQNVSQSLQAEIMRLDAKLSESQKLITERQEDLFGELQRQEKMMVTMKDEIQNDILIKHKEYNSEFENCKSKIEKANNYIKEQSVMIKYDLEETKKDLDKRCTNHEKLISSKFNDLDSRVNKKIDDFTVLIDNNLRSHIKKVDENLQKQTVTIENNKKATDEHIKQQANSIRALSRALTEKEAAERKDAIDQLALKIANKFAQVEMEFNAKLLKLEVEVNKYTDIKIKWLEEHIMLEIQPKLIMEKIISSLENEERICQIKALSEKFNTHVEKYNKEMSDVGQSLVKVNENLKNEIIARNSAIDAIKTEIIVKEIIRDMVCKVEDEEMTLIHDSYEERFSSIEKEHEKLRQNVEKDSVLATCQNIAMGAALNTVESGVVKVADGLKIIGDELVEKVKILDTEIKDEIYKNAGNNIAMNSAIISLEQKVYENIEKDQNEFKEKLKNLDNEIKDEIYKNTGNNIAMNSAIISLENKVHENEEKNTKEIQERFDSIDNKLSELNQEINDEACKNAGNNIALVSSINSVESRIFEENSKLNQQLKQENEKITELNSEIHDEVTKNSVNKIAMDVSINSIENLINKISGELMENLNKNNVNVDIKFAKSRQEMLEIIHNLADRLDSNVGASSAEQIANKVALNDIENRLSIETQKLIEKMELMNEELTKKLGTSTGEIDEVNKKQEEKLKALFTKLEEADKMLNEFTKNSAEIKNQLTAEISASNKIVDDKLVALKQEFDSKTEEVNKNNEEKLMGVNKQLEEKVVEMDKKIEDSYTGVKQILENSAKLQEQMNGEIQMTLKKCDILEKNLNAVEPKLAAVEATNKKVKEEAEKKFQETLGTLNNEVESLNKRIESDLSQARIDIESKSENSIKALETRVKALEVGASK